MIIMIEYRLFSRLCYIESPSSIKQFQALTASSIIADYAYAARILFQNDQLCAPLYKDGILSQKKKLQKS